MPLNINDMPHVIISGFDPWAENPNRLPDRVKLALLQRHCMFRVVCPWDGVKPLLSGDIAIHRERMDPKRIQAETLRLKALGVRVKVMPFLAMMGPITAPR